MDPHAGMRLLHCGQRAGPESHRVVIRRVQCEPAEPVAVIGAVHPLRQQRCLPPARGCTHQGELADGFCGEPVGQAGSVDKLAADRRGRQFGGEHDRPLTGVS